MNLRQYFAALGASSVTWLFGQLGVLILIPVFELVAKLPLSTAVANLFIFAIYGLFQSGLAFLATLIATNLQPLAAQRISCWIFAATGLALLIWLQVAVFRPFERHFHQHHFHQHGIVYDTLTNPFMIWFCVGAFFCCLYVMIRKPVEPLIRLL